MLSSNSRLFQQLCILGQKPLPTGSIVLIAWAMHLNKGLMRKSELSSLFRSHYVFYAHFFFTELETNTYAVAFVKPLDKCNFSKPFFLLFNQKTMNTTEEQSTETDRETIIDFDFKLSDSEVAIIFSLCVFVLPLLGNDLK